MPIQGIIRMNHAKFIMQLPNPETGYLERIMIIGTGLSYNHATAEIIGGTIKSITTSTLDALGGGQFATVATTRFASVNSTAENLTDFMGTSGWNLPGNSFGLSFLLKEINPNVVSYSSGASQPNVIEGGAGSNLIKGSAIADSIYAGGGNDLVNAFSGNDTLYGGAGDDSLRGHNGNDVIYGNSGLNKLSGGAGNDMLHGGNLNEGSAGDIISGGVGNDVLNGHGGNDVYSGGSGNDTFVFNNYTIGTINLRDFSVADDKFQNEDFIVAQNAYDDFMEHATQHGSNARYQSGELTIELRHVKIADLTVDNFAGTDGTQLFMFMAEPIQQII